MARFPSIPSSLSRDSSAVSAATATQDAATASAARPLKFPNILFIVLTPLNTHAHADTVLPCRLEVRVLFLARRKRDDSAGISLSCEPTHRISARLLSLVWEWGWKPRAGSEAEPCACRRCLCTVMSQFSRGARRVRVWSLLKAQI